VFGSTAVHGIQRSRERMQQNAVERFPLEAPAIQPLEAGSFDEAEPAFERDPQCRCRAPVAGQAVHDQGEEAPALPCDDRAHLRVCADAARHQGAVALGTVFDEVEVGVQPVREAVARRETRIKLHPAAELVGRFLDHGDVEAALAPEGRTAMVQVDVLWSYGIGASMALGAARQLRARREIVQAEREGGERPEPLPGDPRNRASLRRNPSSQRPVSSRPCCSRPAGLTCCGYQPP
jgi:hypothetical protein